MPSYQSGIEIPKVDFDEVAYSQIEDGSYFMGFNLGNGGKLSKMDNTGVVIPIEGSGGGGGGGGVGDAAADGVTKGVATFKASDFNSAAGVISIDYTNGLAATSTSTGFLTSGDWSIFNGKQAAITGAATTITTSNLLASRALASDASGKVGVSFVTSTELGYVAGATGPIQTQLNAKTNKLISTNRQTSNYILALPDADKLVEMHVSTANTLTVPLNSTVAFPVGTQILIAQYGTGTTAVTPESGVTIRSNSGKLKLNVQYSGATLIKIATDEWYLFGDITL